MADLVAEGVPLSVALLLAAAPYVITQYVYPKLSYDVRKDFVPLGLLQTTPTLLVVNPALGVNTMGGHADHSHASMVFDGRYKSIFYHGHDLAELFDSREDPEEYDNLWLHKGNEALKLAQMRSHMNALMATVDVGPPRFVNY